MKKLTNKANQHKIDLQALEESEARFRGIVLWSPDAIIVTDTKGKIEYMNPAAEGVFNRKVESFIGKDFGLPLIDDESTEIDIFRSGKEPGVGDMRVMETEWLHKKAHLIMIRDITERKKAEEELNEAKAKDEAILGCMVDGMIEMDQDWRIVTVNKAAENFLGWEDGGLIGKSWQDALLVQDDKGRIIALDRLPIQTVLVAREIEATDRYFIRKNGTRFPVAVTASPVILGGVIAGLIIIFRDITKEKEINRMKNEFISLVSHQLKTPIAEMKGYIENMLEGVTGDLTIRQRQYFNEMLEVCARAYRLISDLLSISMIERGALLVNMLPIKLGEIVDLSVKNFLGTIKKKDLVLSVSEKDKDVIVLADKDKTIEALNNVIDNAVKFTDKGSIVIEISGKTGYGVVEVKDTGRGMSREVLNNLFKKETVLGGEPIAGKGAGIGLYIAKSFIQQQKGDISVTSILDKGSTFIFKIPKA